MLHQLSDAQLLHATREGDTSAFRTLYDRYWQRIYQKACQRVDSDTAKDMVQEVMTTLWRRRNEVSTSENGEIGGYLFTAIKYRVISHYAYSKSEIQNQDVFEILSDAGSWQTIETKEFRAFIESEISRLPARMQQVFRMSREEDSSIADIADQLNVSEQTVKNQLTEALRRLRESIYARDNTGRSFMLFLLFFFAHH